MENSEIGKIHWVGSSPEEQAKEAPVEIPKLLRSEEEYKENPHRLLSDNEFTNRKQMGRSPLTFYWVYLSGEGEKGSKNPWKTEAADQDGRGWVKEGRVDLSNFGFTQTEDPSK